MNERMKETNHLSIWFQNNVFTNQIKLYQQHYCKNTHKTNKNRDEPFTFKLGTNEVIEGWEHGLSSMCIGERRKLTVPSDLAYGEEGAPPKIHPGATLVFDIELVNIIDKDVHVEEYLDYYEMSHFTGL